MHVYHVLVVYPGVDAEKAFENLQDVLVRVYGYDYAVKAEGFDDLEDRRRYALELIEEMLDCVGKIRRKFAQKTIDELDRDDLWDLRNLLVYMDYCAATGVPTLWLAKDKSALVERLVVIDHESSLKAIRAVHAAKEVVIVDTHW